MKKRLLPILISIFMVTSVSAYCFADESTSADTTVPEQTEAVVADTTVADVAETPAETTTEAPVTTAAEAPTSSVDTGAEYDFKTPFKVTVLKDNTAVYADATCTTYRMVMNGELLTVVGSDGTFFKLDSGEYIVNYALEFAEDASFEKAATTEAPTEPAPEETSESTFQPNGIEMYEEPEGEGDGTVKAKEAKSSDPRFTIFCIACGLGLAIGALGGFFAGGWWNKRKMNAEHDSLYQSIKYGETKEALDKEKAEIAKEKKAEKALKQAEAKKKRAELVQSLKDKKAAAAEKKAEQERKKKLEEFKKLQQALGMAPTEDPDTMETVSEPEAEPEISNDDFPMSTKPPFQLTEDFEEEEAEPIVPTTTFAEPRKPIAEETQVYEETEAPTQDVVDREREVVVEKPQRMPKKKEIRPEDMEYGGKDNGGYDYYWDPNDPKDEPFRIKDGKKAFYPDKPGEPFRDEDGNKVEF